jgi:SPFH domain / Band 7 family
MASSSTSHKPSIALRIVAVVGCLALVFGVIAAIFSTRFSTAPDQAGLHYNAGPLSSTKFADCVEPGTRVWNGPGDKHYAYPSGQRTFTLGVAAPDGTTVDSGPLIALTKDNIELSVTGVVSFTLNTDCDTLREFHEKIGLKFEAAMDGNMTSDGWHQMLNVYLQQSLQRAVNDATQDLEWRSLYNDSTVKAAWEESVREALPTYVRQAMGGDYFSNFSITIQKPDLPSDLAEALRATQVAVEQNNAQSKQNERVATELESIAALVAVLGPDGYNTYQAIKDGRIDIYPIPQGSSVIVGGGSGSGPTAEATE